LKDPHITHILVWYKHYVN